MFDLTGKTALVTGASGGIGGAIATALHARGAAVALSGTRKDALDALAETLGGDRCCVLPCNLSDAGEVDALPGKTETALGGRLDILVNNAGLTRDGLVMRMKDEDWDTVLAVNLTAAFRLSRAAVKGMMKRRWGRIISISSVVGTTGGAGQANYAASKAGLVGMTKSMAAELASRGITVNCIAPGFIGTPMTEVLSDERKSAILTSVPAGRMGTVEEIGAAAVYLASNEAAYVTGQTLHVNGGLVMI